MFSEPMNYKVIIEGERKVSCICCKWSAKLKDCTSEYVNEIRALSGWRGYEFKCPECGFCIERDIHVMS